MEIKDIAGLSKLIEVIAQGVGGVFKPYLIKKNAEAKAYEMKLFTDAETYRIRELGSAVNDVRQELGIADYSNEELSLLTPSETHQKSQLSLPERAEQRRKYQEQVEQLNVEQITGFAAEELAQEEAVSSEGVDTDWVARFFDYARFVSNEQMQFLWGKILAGEVKQPNSYSLRTLEVLRNLSKNEAETFVKVAKASIRSGKISFILYEDNQHLEEEFGITFLDILNLQEIGLITSNDFLQMTFKQSEKLETSGFTHGQALIIWERPNGTPAINFAIRGFTRIGDEMLKLVNVEPNMEYMRRFANILKRSSPLVKYTFRVKIEGDLISYDTDSLMEFIDLETPR